jgi:hypothetical protein
VKDESKAREDNKNWVPANLKERNLSSIDGCKYKIDNNMKRHKKDLLQNNTLKLKALTTTKHSSL